MNKQEIKQKIEIEEASLEAYPYGSGYSNDVVTHQLGFREGLNFGLWLNDVSMSHDSIPLKIKYRMYKNQNEKTGNS